MVMNMKKLLGAALASFALVAPPLNAAELDTTKVASYAVPKPTKAAFTIFQTTASSTAPVVTGGWQQILIGAGGFFRGLQVAQDNTQLTTIDGGASAYLWNATATAQNGATGVWNTILTTNSLPASLSSNPLGFASGSYETKMQYTNSSNLYTVFPIWIANGSFNQTCGVYASTNKGVNWTLTPGFSEPCSDTPGNGTFRGFNNRIDIDPTNNSNVFLGTQGLGIFFTQNSGATWTAISTSEVPIGANEGITGIQFNPTNHNNLIACVGGQSAVVSNNATSANPPTFTTTTGGPQGCRWTDVDRSNGNFYAVDDTGENLWVWNGTAWNKILTSTLSGSPTIVGVAVDPNTANHVIAMDVFGNLNETFNGNAATPTFGGWTNSQDGPLFTFTDDAVWLGTLASTGNDGNNLGFDGITFDRGSSLILHANTQNGYFTVTLPGAITASSQVTWESQSRGVENLTTMHTLSMPTASPTHLMLTSADHPLWPKTSANLNSYSNSFQPAISGDLCVGWDADYPFGSPADLVEECDGVFYYPGSPAAVTAPGFSSNNGSSFTLWTSLPTGATNGGFNVAYSTPNNCMYAPSGGVAPSISNNCNVAAPTWTQISLPGSPSLTKFLPTGIPSNGNGKLIGADRATAGVYYLFIPGTGFYIGTNCTTTCTWNAGATNTDFFLEQQPYLKTTLGVGQDFFVAGGFSFVGGSQPQGGFLYHTIDGGATAGNLCQVTSMVEPTSVGFGHAAPGKTFPAVFVAGNIPDSTSTTMSVPAVGASVSFTASTGSTYYPVGTAVQLMAGGAGSQNQFNGKVTAYNSASGLVTITVNGAGGSGSFNSWGIFIPGVWENDTFTHTSCQPTSQVWQLVGSVQFPLGSLQVINDLDGDANTYQQVYVSLGFQGWAYFTP
jgi:hypothetical protein